MTPAPKCDCDRCSSCGAPWSHHRIDGDFRAVHPGNLVGLVRAYLAARDQLDDAEDAYVMDPKRAGEFLEAESVERAALAALRKEMET